ncbi:MULTISPECIES: universal stress protein [Denitromonas]|jgi:nucleotide-binding universal stress UspA family protein|uniref:Universal stress protein n=2 Tax=Denitromonas TaxID=139331 RepID=A0A558EEZ3_9RHOO|nr:MULTISPECIES: universal stress protein [Denitromonas]TVO51201.1 universal stress protein [Denitromonas halophila]TVO63136.1 universal stress protein [Denitromonas ohlonensis]TVO71659.1 universal stress protein [Denitromonas ohlonensis]TVT45758.1 MAG: universal stress protein [Denitromonas halophila]TVT71905.1 MAG: universal stress protein [Denitromonas halophila]
MYKHIIVAVDDSPTSQRAIEEAAALSAASGARLTVVHAVDEALFAHFNRVTLASRDAVQQALIKEGQSVLESAVAAATAAGTKPESKLLASEHHSTSDQIVQAVVQLGADLLIVGSHGRRGVQRLLLGSVAEKLLKKVSISVMVVRGTV